MTEKKEKKAITLTNPQKKYLRGLGHNLNPVVYIGKEGMADSVFDAIEETLQSHELIKVKIINNSPVNKHDAAAVIPEKSGSALVQLIGKTLLLYRPNKKKKKDQQIKLP